MAQKPQTVFVVAAIMQVAADSEEQARQILHDVVVIGMEGAPEFSAGEFVVISVPDDYLYKARELLKQQKRF